MNRSFQNGRNAITRNQDSYHDDNDEEDNVLVVPDLVSFPGAPFVFLGWYRRAMI